MASVASAASALQTACTAHADLTGAWMARCSGYQTLALHSLLDFTHDASTCIGHSVTKQPGRALSRQGKHSHLTAASVMPNTPGSTSGKTSGPWHLKRHPDGSCCVFSAHAPASSSTRTHASRPKMSVAVAPAEETEFHVSSLAWTPTIKLPAVCYNQPRGQRSRSAQPLWLVMPPQTHGLAFMRADTEAPPCGATWPLLAFCSIMVPAASTRCRDSSAGQLCHQIQVFARPPGIHYASPRMRQEALIPAGRGSSTAPGNTKQCSYT